MADEKPNQETEDENTAAGDAKQPAEDQLENAAGDDAENTDDGNIELDPIAVLEMERDDLKDQALRAMAEVENMRRRTERELSQARRYGHANFARDLLAAIDNLKRAVDVLPEDRSGLDANMTNLVVGVEMIHQEITSVLERHGITMINPEGEKFDYDKHQAMFEVPTNDVDPGVVVQVAQNGWMLHDRLLTPAMVGVSKPADDAETTEN